MNKTRILRTIFVGFVLAVCQIQAEETTTHDTENLIGKAKNTYDSGLYDQSIPLFRKLLPLLHSNTEQRAWARLRLGQAYYFTNQFHEVTKSLSEIHKIPKNSNPTIQKYNSEAIFLLGISYGKLGEYDKVTTTLLRYLSLENNKSLPFYDEALYELGMAYFHLKEYSKAKQLLTEITQNKMSPYANIYLARIAIAENDPQKAQEIIKSLEKEASIHPIFPYSLAFLRGELAFSKGNWSAAIEYFEKAMPQKNIRSADWAENALFYLGWSHLNQCEEKADPQYHLDKSEKIFTELTKMAPSDEAYLALAQSLLLQGNLLKDQEAFKKVKQLLNDETRFSTQKTKHYALLLRAEATASYNERRKFFRQLTNESNRESPYFANAWYLKGINEFDEGQKKLASFQNMQANKHFDSAITDFQHAFTLLYPKDKKLAALSLKFQVESYYYTHSREGYLKGLALLGKILNEYRDELFYEYEDLGEIYFLQGLIAANLLDGGRNETFYSIATSSLIHNIQSYPNGAYFDQSLLLLGTLYYNNEDYSNAEEIFIKLANKNSTLKAEALFWAANSAEMVNEDPEKVKKYRSILFEKFSDSPFAAEAFFRYYDYSSYLKNEPKKIDHLYQLIKKFPSSPFTLNALYLLALGKKPSQAAETFDQIEVTFHRFLNENLIPNEKLPYFIHLRYRSLLEKGRTLINYAEELSENEQPIPLQDAENSLYLMYSELNDLHNPLAQHIISGKSLSPIQEECAFYLAKCYILEGDDPTAERVLEKMHQNYENAKVTRGYFYSKTWFEMGKMKMRQQDYHLALEHLSRAEDAAKGKTLRTDELLDLWIEQSECHRCLQKMDDAMLILSRVINYDAVSTKRLQAMYLRAIIYEEQGRKELAKRQLEAVSKKNGPWSLKAKEKLEKNYVYQ